MRQRPALGVELPIIDGSMGRVAGVAQNHRSRGERKPILHRP